MNQAGALQAKALFRVTGERLSWDTGRRGGGFSSPAFCEDASRPQCGR